MKLFFTHSNLCNTHWTKLTLSLLLPAGRGRRLRILRQASVGHPVLSAQLLRRVWQRRCHDERGWDAHVLLPNPQGKPPTVLFTFFKPVKWGNFAFLRVTNFVINMYATVMSIIIVNCMNLPPSGLGQWVYAITSKCIHSPRWLYTITEQCTFAVTCTL